MLPLDQVQELQAAVVYFLAIDTRGGGCLDELGLGAVGHPLAFVQIAERRRSSGAARAHSSSITVTLGIAVLICSSISSSRRSHHRALADRAGALGRRAHLAQGLAVSLAACRLASHSRTSSSALSSL